MFTHKVILLRQFCCLIGRYIAPKKDKRVKAEKLKKVTEGISSELSTVVMFYIYGYTKYFKFLLNPTSTSCQSINHPSVQSTYLLVQPSLFIHPPFDCSNYRNRSGRGLNRSSHRPQVVGEQNSESLQLSLPPPLPGPHQPLAKERRRAGRREKRAGRSEVDLVGFDSTALPTTYYPWMGLSNIVHCPELVIGG